MKEFICKRTKLNLKCKDDPKTRSSRLRCTLTKNNISLLEYLKLHKFLIDNGLLEDIDFLVNKRYPNSTRYYDFYFPKINLYIEIAGRLDLIEYKLLMHQKYIEFGSKIIMPCDIKSEGSLIIGRIKEHD